MSSVFQPYTWKLLWRDSQRDEDGQFYGHSFYRDEVTALVSVKDMSGDLPHETDDGVLWVDHSRPVTFTLGERCDRGGGYASLPVICARHDKKSWVSMRWQDAAVACRKLGLRVEVEPAIGELMALIVEVATLKKEGK